VTAGRDAAHVVDQLCDVTAREELIAAVVVEATLNAGLGALPGKSASILASGAEA
jgi:hypothetical protein